MKQEAESINAKIPYSKQIYSFLKSPGGIITIIIAILTVTISIIVTYLFRSVNEITIDYENSIQIVTKSNSVFKFSYGNIELENAFLTTMTITNTGNYAIVEEDFRDPLLLVLDNDLSVYDVLVVDTTGLFNEITIYEGNNIRIENLFLNPKDFITIQILSDREILSLDVTHRIVGLENVKTPYKFPNWVNYTFVASISSVAASIISFSFSFYLHRKRKRKYQEIARRRLKLDK